MPTKASTLFAPSNGIYLLSHSIGRMPLGAEEALEKNLYAHWKSDEVDIWDHWLGAIDDFRSALGGLYNSPANAFCPQTNISSGLVKVIQALPIKSGRNIILMCEDDFPSVGFALQYARQAGFELRVLPKGSDIQSLATWDAALVNDVHTVLITHVQYSSSKRAPVQEICALARARGITSIIDIAQSAGVVPINLEAWAADVVLGSCIKWLCGGPGAGYLWANPQFIEQLQPKDVGWFSHANPFEFDINHFEYAPDSARFWGGTPSVAPYIIAANSINQINSIGVENIQAHNQTLIDSLTSVIGDGELVSPARGELRGGTVVANVADREAVENRLTAANVKYDARATGLRLSPHIYNSEEEIETVKECLIG